MWWHLLVVTFLIVCFHGVRVVAGSPIKLRQVDFCLFVTYQAIIQLKTFEDVLILIHNLINCILDNLNFLES